MEVEYINKTTKLTEKKTIDAVYAVYDEELGQWKWYVDLDTSDMEDGTIKAWVTAIDVNGNKTTTTDIVYFVKNTPPQIKLNMPLVDDANWDDDVFLNDLINSDPLFLGFELIGLATDNYGIEEGYPKIMIWPADFPDLDADGLPFTDNGQYGTWRSLVVSNPKQGLTAAKFSWPMQRLISDPSAPGGYRLPKDNEPRTYLSQGQYRIRIVTKDLFGNENYYPNRTDHGIKQASKKYVEISYIASDIPIIQVTTYPQYYNAANDFEVNFLVSCTNELLSVNPVAAYITDGNDGYETELGGPYYPTQLTFVNSPYQFKLTITSEQAKTWKNPKEGTLFVRLIAKDKSDKSGPPTYQHFQYDITPPEVPIDRPVSLSNIKSTGKLNGGKFTVLYPAPETPKWVTGSITVGGINTDDFGIKDVYYHIGKLGDDINPAGFWGDHYNDSGVWTDAKLNTSKPDDGWSGSVYAWTYTKTYPIGFKNGNLDIIQEFEDLVGYPTLDNSDTNKPELERFYLPFYVKVVDNAGNFHIVHYKLCIDPLLDEPQVTIVYPKENDTVGGTLRISGSATDNYWMHTVLIRVRKDGDSAYYLPTTTPETKEFYNLPGNESYPKPKVGGVEDTAGWFKATKNGDDVSVSWSSSINQDKLLNHSNPDLNQKVWIEAVAIDTNEITHQTPHITGPVSKIFVNFSSKVPTIDDSIIQKENLDPVELDAIGTKSSGKFKIILDVSAAEGFSIFKARINDLTSTDCNIILNNYLQPLPTGWTITTLPDNGNRKCYRLTIDIDSTTATSQFPTAISYGTTGNLKLEFSLEDMTEQHFFSTGTYNIGIDNFSPKAKILTSKIATGNFLVEGTAQDWGTGSGNIQGLERVLVYVEQAVIKYSGSIRTIEGNGTYLLPATGGTAPQSDFITYPNLIDTTISDGQIPNYPNFPTFPKLVKRPDGVWTSNAALVIDNAENDPTKDYDNDGTYGEMWNGLIDKEWGARLDTTKFSDGPYMLHYIVMDQAGNATHYQDDIFIENKKPFIKSINIGTDINFDNSVTDGTSDTPNEFRRDAYQIDLTSEGKGYQVTPPKEFRIRNNLFGLKLDLTGGNITKNVLVAYVTKSAVKDVTDMERGRVYEIAETAVSTDFRKYGAANNYTGTVFVASGKGEGAGKVYQWVSPSNSSYQYFTGLGGGDFSKTVNFNEFTDVPDGAAVNFVVKVYDAALTSPLHGNPQEYDQLGHAVLLTVAVSNNDTENPSITTADFGQKHVTSTWISAENRPGDPQNNADKVPQNLTASEYTVNVAVDSEGNKLGYVQYGKDNTPADTTANISGKVTFTGIAADNHRINRITAQISGYPAAGAGTEITIANWSGGKLVPAPISTDWTFEIEDEVPQLSLEYGHAVNWTFSWDSSKHSSVVASGVTVTFKAYDFSNLVNTSQKTVNIVPYISEIVTNLSSAYEANPSAFNRSAKGWYPVHEDEVITIKGFNLYSGSGNPTVHVRPNAADAYNAAGVTTLRTQGVNGGTGTSHSATTIYARVDDDATDNNYNSIASGYLVVRVGTVDSINNTNSATAAYNREGNGLNNDTLTDDRALYVWNTGSMFTTAPVSQVFNPFMRLDQNAHRLISYGYYPSPQNGRLRVNRDGADLNLANASYNRMVNTTVAVSTQNAIYAAGSDITAVNNSNPFIFAWSNGVGGTGNNTTGGTATSSGSQNLVYLGSDSDQFKIPRIAVQSTINGIRTNNNGDRIYMSHFDTSNNQVIFRIGGVGLTAQSNVNTTVTIASDTSTYPGSIYTAVGYLSNNNNGLPVIAWYDRTHQKLILSWGNNFTSDLIYNNAGFRNYGTTDWQGKAVEIASNKGAHVDMVVDGNNNIHLAYYDVVNGGLWYTYIPVTGTGTSQVPNPSAKTTVKVDTYLSAGTKIMLNVRNEDGRYVPYISYAHASFAETKNSIRVAWLTANTPQDGTNSKDSFTGAWEVMTVPVTRSIPLTDDFICNGVPTGTSGWNTQVTGTSTELRGYFSSAAATGNTNYINKSIIVGYMTDKWYEGAVLKKQLY